jgi:hypothetical protein
LRAVRVPATAAGADMYASPEETCTYSRPVRTLPVKLASQTVDCRLRLPW